MGGACLLDGRSEFRGLRCWCHWLLAGRRLRGLSRLWWDSWVKDRLGLRSKEFACVLLLAVACLLLLLSACRCWVGWLALRVRWLLFAAAVFCFSYLLCIHAVLKKHL